MHLILTGATGLVGSATLAYILSLPASSQLTRLSILSRRPVPLASHPPTSPNLKIETIIHADFNTYPAETLDKLKGAHGVIWALGISQNEVSKDDYIKITKDYTLAAAKAFSTLDPESKFNFVHVSGEGATLTPGRFTPLFGRVKGETELALATLPSSDPKYSSLRVYNARPGAVDPTHDALTTEAVKDKNRGLVYNLARPVMMPLVSNLFKGMHSPTQDLGKALVELAMGDGEPLAPGKGVEAQGRTVGNVGLRRLAGLK